MFFFKGLKSKIFTVVFLFVLGSSLRLFFAPPQNTTADPFEIITAAKTISERGVYLVPIVGSADLNIHYKPAGWPVGFPLMLSALYNLLGYSELLARLFTVFLGSFVIVFVFILADLFFGGEVAFLSGLMLALNPLLVAFNGRIFTNNPELCFLYASITCLLLAVVEKSQTLKFINILSITTRKKRFLLLLFSFFLLGFLLTIRDTASMFLLVYAYIFYQAGFFSFYQARKRFKQALKLFFVILISFIVGYLPSLYFNFQNYGYFLISTTYKWGGKLNFHYMLFGSGGLSGAAEMFLTGLFYTFPILSLFFINKFTRQDRFLVVCYILMFIVLILINGAYPINGASPRYILPLIPFMTILAAHALLTLSPRIMWWGRSIIILFVVGWFCFLFYPWPGLFSFSPKFAYATYYSPVYQKYPFNNYPTHINALTCWVKAHTPKNAVILVTSAQPYHFYYYAQRDTIIFSNVTTQVLESIIKKRPVYIVEEHIDIYNPDMINNIKNIIKSCGFSYVVVGEIPLFSPRFGQTKMHIYQVKDKSK